MFTSGPVSSEIAVVSFGMFMRKASHKRSLQIMSRDRLQRLPET
jgi:hypothetical protein